MAALPNHRQERFVQLWKQGFSRRAAYPLAGYKPDDGAPYRLSANVRVKRRFAELTKGLAMKTRVTVESITTELDRIAAGAEADKQFGAAKGAVETKAKLHGLLVERKETGAPGDFAGLNSADDVLALVREQLGAEATALLAAALARRDEPAEALPAIAATREAGDTLN